MGTRCRVGPWASLFAACVALLSPMLAFAQGTARSQNIDTSIRAAGMGGASAGVWWGEPGVWGNPASLSTVLGVGWLEGRTQLVPGLASDVVFKSRRIVVGGAGVGVSLMGEPFNGLGRTRLDYGASEITDPFGNPTGTFSAYEQINAWGLGVSPLQLVYALRDARGGIAARRRSPVDFALGVQSKHTRVALAPASAFGTAETDCMDWGASGRVSVLPGLAPDAPFHLDLSGGFAVLNANDASFVFLDEDTASPPTRIRRMGFAVHASLPSPWSVGGGGAPIWLLAGEPHALELGLAVDQEHVSAGGRPPGHDVSRIGFEVTAFSVLSGRFGHVTDRTGQIVGSTSGWGVRLPIGPWASVAYDRASIPQANGSGLPDVKRRSWSVWLDPVRVFAREGTSR